MIAGVEYKRATTLAGGLSVSQNGGPGADTQGDLAFAAMGTHARPGTDLRGPRDLGRRRRADQRRSGRRPVATHEHPRARRRRDRAGEERHRHRGLPVHAQRAPQQGQRRVGHRVLRRRRPRSRVARRQDGRVLQRPARPGRERAHVGVLQGSYADRSVRRARSRPPGHTGRDGRRRYAVGDPATNPGDPSPLLPRRPMAAAAAAAASRASATARGTPASAGSSASDSRWRSAGVGSADREHVDGKRVYDLPARAEATPFDV